MKVFRMSRVAAGLTVFSAMVATAMAAVLTTTTTIGLPSVDSYGNPSTNVLGVGTGKIYKDEHLGIITGTFTGKILNKSKAKAKFVDQGVSITDPWTNETVSATSDVEVVSKPIIFWSKASLTVTYNPLVAVDW